METLWDLRLRECQSFEKETAKQGERNSMDDRQGQARLMVMEDEECDEEVYLSWERVGPADPQ